MAKSTFEVQNDVSLAISDGLINGMQHFGQFGYNPDLSAGVEATVWPGPTPMYIFPDSAGEAMELVSTNVADTQTILIQALDADWNQVNIPLALTGITPVALPFNVARINRVINISTTETLGDVSVRGAGAGPTYCLALAEQQISTQVIFSVPAGFKAKLETTLVTLNHSGGADAGVIFRYRRRDFGSIFGTGARFGLNKKGTSAVTVQVDGVAPLNPKSDAYLLGLADSNSTDVSARLPFILYKA